MDYLKNFLTLVTLVDPFLITPLFLIAVKNSTLVDKIKFARTLALTVAVGLLSGAFLALPLLKFLGVSVASLQIAGGLITLLMALSMINSKEQEFKETQFEKNSNLNTLSIVPLGVPLLVGPAAISYTMASSSFVTWQDTLMSILTPLAVASICWLILETTARVNKTFSPSTLNLIERLSGFLLSAIAIEMMATGIKSLFL